MAARTQRPNGLVLAGDVGGTNARFAIAQVSKAGVRLRAARSGCCDAPAGRRDYPTGAAALSDYLSGLEGDERPRLAVIAAAGPIEKGAVEFTNNRKWRFSETALMKSADLDRVRLINDFQAQALALEHLRPKGLHRIGHGGRAPSDGVAVVMGPGTGFGAAALVL